MDVNHNVSTQTPIHMCTPVVLLLSLIPHQSCDRSIQAELPSKADILNLRGKVLENGVYPRFFRRLAEGFSIQKT